MIAAIMLERVPVGTFKASSPSKTVTHQDELLCVLTRKLKLPAKRDVGPLMTTRKTLLALCLSLLTVSPVALRADSWIAPSPKIFSSEEGDRALKVVPAKEGPAGASWVQFNADGTEKPGERFSLVNMPVRALVPSRVFPYFVTLDTYTSMGFAHTVVIYRNKGEVVRDLKLEDLLTPEEIKAHVPQTVSSRFWRNGANIGFVIPKTVATPGQEGAVAGIEKPEDIQLQIEFTWGKIVNVRLRDGEVSTG